MKHLYAVRTEGYNLHMLELGDLIASLWRFEKSKWVWSGNATITNGRQPHGTARKSLSTITGRQEDKLSKAISSLFPIKIWAAVSLSKQMMFSCLLSADLSFNLKFHVLQVGRLNVQMSSNTGTSLNKVTIVSSESKERTNILGRFWHWPYLDCLYLYLICFYSRFWHNMTRVGHLRFQEFAYWCLELEVVYMQSWENFL